MGNKYDPSGRVAAGGEPVISCAEVFDRAGQAWFLPSRFSTDDERWPLVAALTWIATRSLKFAEAYVARDISAADALLFAGRSSEGVPPGPIHGWAFELLSQKIQGGQIRGQATKLKWIIPREHEAIEPEKYFSVASAPKVIEGCDFRPQDLKNRNIVGDPPPRLADFVLHDGDSLTPKGSGYGSPNPDGSRVRWSWRGVTFARGDLLRLWPELPCFAAWKQAKAREWRLPQKLSPESLKSISHGKYLPLDEVVKLLAFGPDLLPVGLDAHTVLVARLNAGLALFSAAGDGKVELLGYAVYRVPSNNRLAQVGTTLSKIEPAPLREMTLVIDGAADWIGPQQFANEYPEHGHARESVAFAGVVIDRDSLSRWLAEVLPTQDLSAAALVNPPLLTRTEKTIATQQRMRKKPPRKRAAVINALKKRDIRSKSELFSHPSMTSLAAEIVGDTKEFGTGAERAEAVRKMFYDIVDDDFATR
jgi:hypothetical protein